jgi:hypothetical protein
MQTPSTE